MKLTSIATETSFLNEQDGEYEEEQNGEEGIFSGSDDMDENNELESEIKARNEIKYCERHFRRQSGCGTPQKSETSQSNKQSLNEIANGLKALAETSQKKNEEERKREERYLSFRGEEAEKNSQHELLIAQIFTNASQPQFPYRSRPSHQGNNSTSSTSDPYQPVQGDIRRDSSFYPF